jgi:mercuric ion binding protein
MRKFLMTTILLAAMAGAAQAETIKASVNGLVCAFCATSIEKTFKKQPVVDTVKVDLDTKLVTITTKKDQTLDDETITNLVKDAGYTVTKITREQ